MDVPESRRWGKRREVWFWTAAVEAAVEAADGQRRVDFKSWRLPEGSIALVCRRLGLI